MIESKREKTNSTRIVFILNLKSPRLPYSWRKKNDDAFFLKFVAKRNGNNRSAQVSHFIFARITSTTAKKKTEKTEVKEMRNLDNLILN